MKTKDLADGVRKLKHLDRQCIELSYEHAKPTDATDLKEYLVELFALCYEAFALWNDIKQYMGEASSIKVHDRDIRCSLKRIKDDRELYVIRQYRSLVGLLNTSGEREFEESLDEYLFSKFDELFREFHVWFDYVEFYRRKAQAGCIIVPFHNKSSIDKYYSEIRDAFSFGLFRASIALCRALLELVLFDDVLHLAGNSEKEVTENIAFEVIRDTTFVVEDLLS